MPPRVSVFRALSWWPAGGQRPSLHHAALPAAERTLCGAAIPHDPQSQVDGPLGAVSCTTCQRRLDDIRRWHHDR